MRKINRKKIKNWCYIGLLLLAIIAGAFIHTKIAMAADGISKLEINKNGVATWKEYKGASFYSYSCSTFGGVVYDTTLDLKDMLTSYGKKSGTYMLMIRAMDSEGLPLTDYACVSYQYLSSNDLKTPQKIKWNGYVASWDLVNDADYYVVYLYRSDGSLVCQNISSHNSYDFSTNPSMLKEYGYYFKIVAKNDAGGSSSFSENSSIQKGWNELTKLKAEITKENVLVWSSVSGAERYQWTLDGVQGGQFVSEGTRIDLANILKEKGAKKGQYQVRLIALGGSDSNYSAASMEWIGSFIFDPSIVTYKEELRDMLMDSSWGEIVLKEDVEINDEDTFWIMNVDKIDRTIDLNGHTIYNKKTVEGARGCGIIIVYNNNDKMVTIKDSKGNGKAITDANVLFGISNVKEYGKKGGTWEKNQLMIQGGTFEKTCNAGYSMIYSETDTLEVILGKDCNLKNDSISFNSKIKDIIEKTEEPETKSGDASVSGDAVPEVITSSGEEVENPSGKIVLEPLPISGETIEEPIPVSGENSEEPVSTSGESVEEPIIASGETAEEPIAYSGENISPISGENSEEIVIASGESIEVPNPVSGEEIEEPASTSGENTENPVVASGEVAEEPIASSGESSESIVSSSGESSESIVSSSGEASESVETNKDNTAEGAESHLVEEKEQVLTDTQEETVEETNSNVGEENPVSPEEKPLEIKKEVEEYLVNENKDQ